MKEMILKRVLYRFHKTQNIDVFNGRNKVENFSTVRTYGMEISTKKDSFFFLLIPSLY